MGTTTLVTRRFNSFAAPDDWARAGSRESRLTHWAPDPKIHRVTGQTAVTPVGDSEGSADRYGQAASGWTMTALPSRITIRWPVTACSWAARLRALRCLSMRAS